MTIDYSKIYASSLTDALKGLQDSASTATEAGELINAIIGFALPLSGFSVFMLLSFAAFKMMTSHGNPDKLKDAKEQISNAIIGFLFIVLSVAILALIGNILQINISGE